LGNPHKSFRTRFGGLSGILAPVLAFAFICLAIANYPQFNWYDNALSDLGVVPGITATLFNFGLFISGLFSLNFAAGLYRFLGKHIIGKLGAVVFAAACLSLIGIASAPENVRPFHYYFSVAFFSLVPIALLIIAGYLFVARMKPLAAFTLLISLFAAAPWVLYFQVQFVQGVAIPEVLSALAGSIWAFFIGWKMLRTDSNSTRY